MTKMKSVKIPQSLFIKNRSKLFDLLLPNASVLLFSAGQQVRNGDQFFPYRQSSDFLYLTGIPQEQSVLMLNPWHPEKDLREILFLFRYSPEKELWNGRKLRLEEASEISGIRCVRWLDEYEKTLNELLPSSTNIYLNIPEGITGSEESGTDVLNARKVMDRFPLHSFHRLAPLLTRLRSVKEEEELNLIREAIAITGEAFLKVPPMLKPGLWEYEVEAVLNYEFTRSGASGHAYEPIIASGENACILHYVSNNRICRKGDLLLMDFGAEYAGYAADCTRTLPVSGKFSRRQAEIYDALLEVFYQTRSLMKPGILMQDFHKQVCERMQDMHIRLGLYSQKQADAAGTEKPLWFRYYMHGTSHSIGLDVHDPFDRQVAFAPGMVLSCEPAIYIREEKIGIRLENDILITPEGNIDLMKDIPIERKDIEALFRT
jgi:Xaa-Pro aminopeptidase